MIWLMLSVYVLKLTHNKYYVGKTGNVMSRLQDHCKGSGSVWTDMYQPIEILEQHIENSPFDEDNKTLEYMGKYGIENVRGGSFCQITLTPAQVSVIQSMINSSQDKCFKCQKKGHFQNQCEEPDTETRINSSLPMSNIYMFTKENNVARQSWYTVKFPGVFRNGEQRHYSISIVGNIEPVNRFTLEDYVKLSNLVWNIPVGIYDEKSYFSIVNKALVLYRENPNTIDQQIVDRVVMFLRNKGYGSESVKGKIWFDHINSEETWKSFIQILQEGAVGIKFTFCQKPFLIVV